MALFPTFGFPTRAMEGACGPDFCGLDFFLNISKNIFENESQLHASSIFPFH